MKKYFITGLLLAGCFCNSLLAQDSTKAKTPDKYPPSYYNFWDHVFTGGGFIVTISSDVTAVGIQPLFGYRFTDKFSAGINGNYIYLRQRYPGGTYSTSIYGAGLFARRTIFEQVFAQAEPGFTNYDVLTFDPKIGHATYKRQNVPYMLLGGGYAQEIGSNSYLELVILYDVLYDSARSFTGSPIVFRAGFNFGL